MQELITQIKENLDIVEVISQYINLEKYGTNYRALCPFHQEKTPSFIVSPEKQIFHCFGCHKGGDIIKFVMEIENISFKEAVYKLAQQANIDIKLPNKDNTILTLKKIIKELNSYYINNLYSNDIESKKAQNYIFEKRKIKKDIAKLFQLGYAPTDKKQQNFINNLEKKYSLNLLKESGIISKKNNLYFRQRITIPIFNLSNEVIAFGARAISKENKIKYLNSPENKLFKKRQLLFNLNKAKDYIRKKKYVILVEGYLDVITLYSYGFYNVVASLGTSLTDQQLEILKRYTQNLLILYDNDNAGKLAAQRVINLAINKGFNIRVVLLNNAKDPDEFLNKFGPLSLKKSFKLALDPLIFLLKIYKEKYKKINKVHIFNNVIFPFLDKIENEIKLFEYITQLQTIFNIDKNYIKMGLQSYKKKNPRYTEKVLINAEKNKDKKSLNKLEKELILFLLNNIYEKNLIIEKFSQKEDLLKNYKILNNLITLLKEDNINLDKIIETLPINIKETYLKSIFFNKYVQKTKEELTMQIDRIFKDIEKINIKNKLKNLKNDIEKISQNSEKIKEYIKNLNKIKR